MKKTKSYNRTRFTASTVSEAVSLLGHDRTVDLASVKIADSTVEYDSEDRFLTAYGSGVEQESELVLRTATIRLRVMLSAARTTVSIEASDEKAIEPIIAVFDNAAKLPDPKAPLDVERFCVVSSLHWETLPLLATRLDAYSVKLEAVQIIIRRYPDVTTYSSWPAALQDIERNGEPKRFMINLRGAGPLGYFGLMINRGRYANTNDPYVSVGLSGIENTKMADDIIAFLGLTPDRPPPSASLARSAFVAHRFDAEGEQVADRLARFLDLLGFDVKTGRGYSPESISEKVRKRIESQALLFVILTPGEDPTWLTQESILAYAKDKRVFVLRDSRVPYKPAFFVDLEYITFESPAVERTFIPILEGLRELGFLSYEAK